MRREHDQVDPAEALMREVGTQLREVREERGEDLAAIAQQLRIRESYLEAIERGDMGVMPGRTYALGFLRSYADHLGFDGDDLVAQIKTTVADLTDRTRLRIRTPLPESRLPKMPILVLSLAAIAGVYAGWSYLDRGRHVVMDSVSEVPNELRNLARDVIPPADGTDEPADDAPAVLPAPSGPAPAEGEAVASDPGPAPVDPEETPVGDAAPSAVGLADGVHGAESGSAAAVADQSQMATTETTAVTRPPDLPRDPVAPSAPEGRSASAGQGSPSSTGESPPSSEPAAPTGARVDATSPPAALPVPSTPGDASGVGQATTVDAIGEVPAPGAGPARAGAPETGLAALGAPDPSVAIDELIASTEPAAGAAPGTPDADPEAPLPAAPSEVVEASEVLASVLDPTTLPDPVAQIVHEPQNTDARVIITALDSSWVRIASVSGDYLRTRTLQAGETFLVPNRDDLRLWTGNAGGLAVLVDGDPLPPLGTDGAVMRDIPLTPEALRARAGEFETPP